VYVCMIIISLIILRCFNAKQTAIVLLIAVLLQIYDLHDWMSGIHKQYTGDTMINNPFKSNIVWQTVARNHDIKHLVWYHEVEQRQIFYLTDWALDHGFTVNNFYFARGIMDMTLVEDRNRALIKKSPENLFIFNVNEEEICQNYNLYCYHADDLVIGYSVPLVVFRLQKPLPHFIRN